jgi:hypothetical protein
MRSVGGAAVETVALHGHDVEIGRGAGVVKPLQKEQVVEAVARRRVAGCKLIVEASAPRITTAFGVGGAQRGGAGLEQLDVRFRVDRCAAPLRVDVRLVPQLIVLDAPAIAARPPQ